MTVAFVFPGQGSQSVGMGKALAEASVAARRTFDEVDEALGEKLSALVWEGPEDRLTLTENAQPALMAVSLAVVRALEERGVVLDEKVAFVAGHSLGEYSALAAAGALRLPDAARLLRLRGRAMQDAVPVGVGAMAALLGLELEAAREVAATAAGDSEVCEAANDNGPGQIVVSGHRSAVERAVALAKERGARRAILLPVSAPFHCALMRPAAERMAAALAEVTVGRPAVPLVANVRAAPVVEPDAIRAALVEQVTGAVRWRESVLWLAGPGGVTRMVELGAGKVLSGLVRRIAPGVETTSIGSPSEVDAAVARLLS